MIRDKEFQGGEIRSIVIDIERFVDNIVIETKSTLEISNDLDANAVADCEEIMDLLEADRDFLVKVGDEIIKANSKPARQKIANVSYEIAKVIASDLARKRAAYDS